MKGVGFREALEYLKGESFASHSAPLKTVQPVATTQPKQKELIKSADLNAVANYYHKQLFTHKEAVSYLEGRSLFNGELIDRYGIGYAPGDLKEKVSDKQFEALKEAGIFTEKGYEALSGCIVFPLRDQRGQTVSFYGRKVSDKSKVQHLYLKGPHGGLFNRKAFEVYPERIIFTESIIDAFSLLSVGIQNAVPLYGVNGFTKDHLAAIKEERTKEIILAFDRDEAGSKGAEKLSGQLLETIPTVRIISPSETKDWNEALIDKTLNKDSVLALIESAPPLINDSPEEKTGPSVEAKNGKYYFTFADITYRLIGVKEGFVSSLKVNIRAEREELKHIDNVDLFSARSRASFSHVLGRLFDVESVRVEKELVVMLEWLEDDRDRKLSATGDEEAVVLTPEDKELGLELLKAPNLFERIENDLSSLGYVGEGSNKRLMYLAASSRKLADPISIIVISQSAAGKSYLIDTVKKLLPPEEVLSMTSLSDQALNYLPEEALLHKFLVMGEAVHSDSVDHQMREMLSAQELSRLVTVKDDKTGRMVSRLVRKKAIVSAVMSSATGEINPENASRCFVISTDESEEQTRAIHREQRRKYSLERFQRKSEDIPAIIKAHQAAQRLLKDRMIVNPFAEHLDFPATLMRSRRDHERFIDLIAAVCFLRQYQKEEMTQGDHTYIECDLEDYRIAYEIMVNILPSTLTNFPKSAQLLYETVRKILSHKADGEGLAVHEVSVTQREIREKAGLEHNFVKRNMRLLAEYEYLEQKGGYSRGGRAHYRLKEDAPLSLFDLSSIPSPDEMKKQVNDVAKSGSDPNINIIEGIVSN